MRGTPADVVPPSPPPTPPPPGVEAADSLLELAMTIGGGGAGVGEGVEGVHDS